MSTKAQGITLLAANKVDATGNVDSTTIDGIDSTQLLRSDQAAELNGTLTADALVLDGLDPAGNVAAQADNIRVSGYGIIGNRDTFYITNPTNVQIGTGTIHNENPAMLFTDTGNTSYRTLYENSNRVFTDGYHPNADKWTTARTFSLTGDVTGTVSVDGSSNISLLTVIQNDSHTHDGRYYTETESDGRFLGITAKAADADKLDGKDGADYSAEAIAYAIALG